MSTAAKLARGGRTAIVMTSATVTEIANTMQEMITIFKPS